MIRYRIFFLSIVYQVFNSKEQQFFTSCLIYKYTNINNQNVFKLILKNNCYYKNMHITENYFHLYSKFIFLPLFLNSAISNVITFVKSYKLHTLL